MKRCEQDTELQRRYKAALDQFRRAQRLEDNARLQAQLAATILAGNSEMSPQDAVDLAFMIVHSITEQKAQFVELEARLLHKAK